MASTAGRQATSLGAEFGGVGTEDTLTFEEASQQSNIPEAQLVQEREQYPNLLGQEIKAGEH